jgi:hypothetical protein
MGGAERIDSGAGQGESLEIAYNRLFKPSVLAEDESSTLAQPSPLRFVPSIATDHTTVGPARES